MVFNSTAYSDYIMASSPRSSGFILSTATLSFRVCGSMPYWPVYRNPSPPRHVLSFGPWHAAVVT